MTEVTVVMQPSETTRPVRPASSMHSWVEFDDGENTSSVLNRSGDVEHPLSSLPDISSLSVSRSAIEGINKSIPNCEPRSKSSMGDDGQIRNNSMHSVSLKESAHPTATSNYKNGDVLVTLLPLNSHCAWITPATFKPELVPEELMAPGLRLTVEDYVSCMQMLVNDFRFFVYILLYKKILLLIIVFGFAFLMTMLLQGTKGAALFVGVACWLVLNGAAIGFTIYAKEKMIRNLERCVAQVNELLMKSNILLGVDDRGKISCHKVNLAFVYFDITYCAKYLNDMILNEERARDPTVTINSTIQSLNNLNGNCTSLRSLKNDLSMSDIIITGATPTRLSQREKYGEKLLLRYSQRWVKQFVRNRLALNLPLYGDASVEPITSLPARHCAKARCLCQYIEEHLKLKPMSKCSFTELLF